MQFIYYANIRLKNLQNQYIKKTAPRAHREAVTEWIVAPGYSRRSALRVEISSEVRGSTSMYSESIVLSIAHAVTIS